MKVILFIDNLGSGGAQRQLVGLAALLRHKYTVEVCTYFPQSFFKQYLDDNQVPNEIIPGAASSATRIWRVYRFFKNEAPDWVIAYQETPSLVACVCKILGCKYKLLVSERNTTQQMGLRERVRFPLYRCANSVVPNSITQGEWLSDHYSWMSGKITTITNFVDMDQFHYVDHHRRPIPLILVVASAMPSKNLHGLILAAKILKEQGRHFTIDWYGLFGDVTEYQKKCFALLEQYSLTDNIRVLPKTIDIYQKYQQADYLCLPSFYEGTPNAICEAIATGLPVMCSNVCDNSLYVEEGKNGILFDPNIPEDIASTMSLLMDQTDAQYYEYRVNSRHIAESKLSCEAFVDKYVKIIENEN